MTDKEIGRLLRATEEWSTSTEGKQEIRDQQQELKEQAAEIASSREIRPDFVRMPLTLF